MGGLFVPLLVVYYFSLQQTEHHTSTEAYFCQLKRIDENLALI